MCKTLQCVLSAVCCVGTDFVPGSVCHCVSNSHAYCWPLRPSASTDVQHPHITQEHTSHTRTHHQPTAHDMNTIPGSLGAT